MTPRAGRPATTAEDWPRIRELLRAVLEKAPGQRTAFLDDVCGEDAALRKNLDALLAAHDEAGDFLESPSEVDRIAAEILGGESALALATGSRVGRYEILELLDAGGMGEVYRARDAGLGRDVAVKVMRPSMRGDTRRLRLFEKEARAAAAISDPNILAVFDVGAADGMPYVVSELLEGETLGARLRRAPLTVRESLEYGIQIAQGLCAAHEKGIVHRDLKPDNVFLTRQGRAKILDFGLAKLLQDPRENAAPGTASSASSSLMGTPGYIAPERLEGRATDRRADIFGLGAILYRMLAGRPAFGGEDTVGELSATLTEKAPPFAAAGNVPPRLQRVVWRCLEKRPEDRFQSAHDVRSALQALAGSPAATRARWPLVAMAALGAVLAATVFLGTGSETASSFHRRIRSLAVLPPRNASPDLVAPPAREHTAHAQTRSVEAYQAYLRGRYYWNLRSAEAAPKAIDQFNRALELDPLYAEAYVGLADTYAMLGDMLYLMPHADAFDRAEAAARRALDLDPTRAQGYASMGHLRMHAWRWEEADRLFQKALELDPEYATALQWRAYNLVAMGRTAEALAAIARARELDPLSLIINTDLAQILYFAARHEDAVAQCAKTLQMNPAFAEARRVSFLALQHIHRDADALADLELYRRLPDGGLGGSVGYAYAALGRRREAEVVLHALEAQSRHRPVPPYDFAVIHAGLGEADQALAWLDTSLTARDPESIILPIDPRLDSLRGDPRFDALLRRMGLPRK